MSAGPIITKEEARAVLLERGFPVDTVDRLTKGRTGDRIHRAVTTPLPERMAPEDEFQARMIMGVLAMHADRRGRVRMDDGTVYQLWPRARKRHHGRVTQ